VFVALVIQLAMPMRRILLSPVVSPARPYSSTLSHKGHNFQEETIEPKISVLILSATFV